MATKKQSDKLIIGITVAFTPAQAGAVRAAADSAMVNPTQWIRMTVTRKLIEQGFLQPPPSAREATHGSP
jgi:hypothetical protein